MLNYSRTIQTFHSDILINLGMKAMKSVCVFFKLINKFLLIKSNDFPKNNGSDSLNHSFKQFVKIHKFIQE